MPLERLVSIMRTLRDPQRGCEWDREQTFATIAPYTIEEAYEVADAIARDDMDALADELGDLQLQVVFHAQMAEEAGEKTEAPTPKRRQQAAEQGRVARSPDLVAAALVVGSMLLLNGYGTGVVNALAASPARHPASSRWSAAC